MDPIEKTRLAQQLDLKSWLYQACAALMMREEPLDAKEGRTLGFEFAFLLNQARERYVVVKASDPPRVCSPNLGSTVVKILHDVFGEEVKKYLTADDAVFGNSGSTTMKAKSIGNCEHLISSTPNYGRISMLGLRYRLRHS